MEISAAGQDRLFPFHLLTLSLESSRFLRTLRESESLMIHYTCDRCKRTIDPEMEARYVVEIDVRMAGVSEPTEEEVEDLDQLAELHDQLQRELNADLGLVLENQLDESQEAACDRVVDEGPEQYDLCEQCHEVFVSNPLGREVAVGLGFSNN